MEAYKLAKEKYQREILIVLVENKFKPQKKFSTEERKEIIKSYLPTVEIFHARNNQELQELWQHAQKVVRKFRGISDMNEDIRVCQRHQIDFQKIEYVKLEKFAGISSLAVKILTTIGEKPAGINNFTFNKLQEKLKPNGGSRQI